MMIMTHLIDLQPRKIMSHNPLDNQMADPKLLQTPNPVSFRSSDSDTLSSTEEIDRSEPTPIGNPFR